MIYYYTPISMIKLKIATTPIAGENVEELTHLNLACCCVKWFSHFGKQFGNSLKTKHGLSYYLILVLLDIYRREMIAHSHNILYLTVIEALFIIAPHGKQFRCPSRVISLANCGTSIPWNTTQQ